jgi:hypothetical protein
MKVKKIKDERVQKSLEQDLAPMYPVLLILTIISLIVKIALKLHPALYIVEIIALILSPSHYIISTARKNILFVKRNDEAITSIKNSAKTNSYMLHFYIFIIGQLILCVSYFFYPSYPKATGPAGLLPALSMIVYLFIGGIPLSIASEKSHKKGLLVAWNSEKSKTTILKRLKLWFTAQAICGGVLTAVLCLLTLYVYIPPKLFDFAFMPVFVVFAMSFMYFPLKKNMIESEKYADKELEHVAKSDENQEGMKCEE